MYFSCSVDENSSKFQISRKLGKVFCQIPKKEEGTVGELVIQCLAPVPFHALPLWDANLQDSSRCVLCKQRRTTLFPGARFSKLPVITGPVKLFCFPFQVGVFFKSFENYTITLTAKETKSTSLEVRTHPIVCRAAGDKIVYSQTTQSQE